MAALSGSSCPSRESEFEVSLVVFTVCPLFGFCNGVSGGMMVVWLCVVSRTSLLYFRSFKFLVTSLSLSLEGVLLATF